MKTLKYICIVGAFAILLPTFLSAQDNRQRDYQTIIADGMAQLPLSDPQKLSEVMKELAGTGQAGMEMMVKMLVPADKGKNALVEYAINGVVNYVTVTGDKTLQENVRKGLATSLELCPDNANRAFLLSQLQLCATSEDSSVFIKYLQDSYLADYAVRGLVAASGSNGEVILNLMKQEAAPRKTLAHIAYERRIPEAEPFLLDWLPETNKETRTTILKALSVCGSSASVKTLAALAKSEAYEWNEEQEATAAYFLLLNRLAAGKEKEAAVKAAKKQLKNAKPYLRGAALNVILTAEGNKAMSYVRTALKDESIEVRNNALEGISAFADEQVYATVGSWIPSLPTQANTDIVRWFGNCHAASQTDVIVEAMSSSDNTLACAGIEAAGRIGGQKALDGLIAQLGGVHAQEASKALLTFNGEIKDGIMKALNADATTQIQVLKICSKRRINEVSGQVFSLLNSENKDVRDAAYTALANTVTYADADRLAGLLEVSDEKNVPQLQKALENAIKPQDSKVQYKWVANRMAQSTIPVRYYPVLAQTNTAECIGLLQKELSTSNRKAAFEAMLKINNPLMIDTLYRIAREKPIFREQALSRYIVLVAQSSQQPSRKCRYYQQALQLNPSVGIQNQVLKRLAEVHKYPALMLASKYLDMPETAVNAASAVKTIVAKSDERLGGDSVRIALEKAQTVYKQQSGADAGYAVDEITTLLSKLQSAPVFTLPADEEKQGYEILFDGTSLQKWEGNTDSYVIENGTIYVSANYGAEGNLYTRKEYGDFVLRFEFCFEREGVNNGIGIRTRQGVDAAYEGMEIQVLDHDAPIYKGLHEYQRHGSVYGIIPAKHIKFGELGSWNVEEIRAVGDRITVTVNGEVILDGDIRKACQGHNVSKDGGKNPYTVDHKNHPGLFNKKGLISFCGHGEGIRFRNVRILDLSKK